MDELNRTVDAWELAARKSTARAAIHPAGRTGDAAYETSGVVAANALDDLFGDYPVTTVGDFGAGDGRVAIPLAALGYQVTAYDASPTMLGRLVDNLPAGVHVEVAVADGTDVLPRRPHDAIYALAVLIHHHHDAARRIITNLAASLAPAGVLVLDLPLYDVPRDPAHWTDVAVWTPDELDELAAALGLTILEANPATGAFDHADPARHGPIVVLRAG